MTRSGRSAAVRKAPLCTLLTILTAAALAASLAACASTSGSGRGARPGVVDEETIEAMRVSSAYDIVSRTRSEFLQGRGRQSLDPDTPALPADVYVDDTFYGGVSTLRTIPASTVAQVRFYQAYEAQYKFGSGHLGGVIQIITKR